MRQCSKERERSRERVQGEMEHKRYKRREERGQGARRSVESIRRGSKEKPQQRMLGIIQYPSGGGLPQGKQELLRTWKYAQTENS